MSLMLPDLVRQRALANGSAGQRWLDDLPDVVEAVAERWGLQVGETLGGGTAAYVANAVGPAGQACVLKVAMSLDLDQANAFSRSVYVHRLAAGQGCAELYDHDEATSTLLLERLGPNLDQLALPVPAIMQAIVTTLQSFWTVAEDDCPLPDGIESAAWLSNFITTLWQELDRPCSRVVVDRAVGYCEQRAAVFDRATSVVVHADAHGWNTLDAGGGDFKFVDPEGLLSEPAQDLSVAMREYNDPLLAGDTKTLVQQRAEWLVEACDAGNTGAQPGSDITVEAVWQWGFIERVSTGLANVRDFDNDEGAKFLEVAERCL